MLRICSGWGNNPHAPIDLDTGLEVIVPKRGRYVSHGMCGPCCKLNAALKAARGENFGV